MEFRVLGLLEVWDDGRALELGRGRQRALLALLLLHANETVSTDRLVDALWGEAAPATAPKVIQGYVSQLRRTLAADAIVTHGAGYRLQVDQTDAAEFERLLGSARAQSPADAARTLRTALALWRGPPYADFEYEPWAQGEINRLDELRLAATEERIEADLSLGLHVDAVAQLEALVAAHPLRERLRAQLMLALYRCGRQAEALEVYRETRSALVDELGVEPGRELQRLERQILAQDPALDLEPAVAKAVVARQQTRRRGMILVALGVVAVAAAAVVAAREVGGGASTVRAVPNSVAFIDPAANRLAGYTAVGNTPSSVAVGAGSAWILNSNEQTLSRVDLASGKLLRVMPAVTPGSDLAFGSAAVWVAGSSNMLARIDPDAENARTMRLPPSTNPLIGPTASWVSARGRTVWATTSGAVLRIEPRPVRRIVVDEPGCCGPVAVGLGAVWIASDSGIVRVDAATLAHTLIPLSFHPAGIAVGAGAVWATDTLSNLVWRIDPKLQRVAGTTSVGVQPNGIAVGLGAVWAASADGTVSKIDPATGSVVATVTVGGTPARVAVGGGRVWVTVD